MILYIGDYKFRYNYTLNKALKPKLHLSIRSFSMFFKCGHHLFRPLEGLYIHLLVLLLQSYL